MATKDNLSGVRVVIALIGIVLFGGTIWAAASARLASLDAKIAGQKELWTCQYKLLREDLLRVEAKVDRLLETKRLVKSGGGDGGE